MNKTFGLPIRHSSGFAEVGGILKLKGAKKSPLLIEVVAINPQTTEFNVRF